MKKILILGLFSLMFTNCQSQFWRESIRGNKNIVKENRKVGNFDGIFITGSYEVVLQKGKEGKLQIQADENLLPIIETYVKGNKLYIKTNKKFEIKKFTSLKVLLPIEDIDKISITGSGTVSSNTLWNFEDLKLSITGSGNIDLNLKSNQIKASVTGSGSIHLQGTSQNVSYSITGSGGIYAQNLNADEAKARVTGSGQIKVKAIAYLDANVTGSGDIIYIGNPERLKSKILGSGSIYTK